MEHSIEVKVTTRYELRCSCGWRVITFDLFETEKLRRFHLEDVER